MATLKAKNENFITAVKDSFAKQSIMSLFNASLVDVCVGTCSIQLPYRDDLCQQDGFFHAGVTSTIADSAGGYAGYSLMPENTRVLTVEFKINLLRPAAGHSIIAIGNVIRAGKNLSFTEVNVFARRDEENLLCATMTQTLACVADSK